MQVSKYKKAINILLIAFSILILGITLYSIFYYKEEYTFNVSRTLEVCKIKGEDSCDLSMFNDGFYYLLSNVLSWSPLYNLTLIFPLLLFIVSLYKITSYFRNNIFKNEINRISYKKIMFKLFLDTYKYSLFYPILFLIVLIITYIFSSKNIVSFELWSNFNADNIIKFIGLYLLNVFLYSFIYISIGLIVARKEHNYLIAVIKSFIIFVMSDLFLELVVQTIIDKLFINNHFGLVFNIVNMISFNIYSYGNNYNILILFDLILLLFLVIINILLYKNKERMLIDCEKNI